MISFSPSRIVFIVLFLVAVFSFLLLGCSQNETPTQYTKPVDDNSFFHSPGDYQIQVVNGEDKRGDSTIVNIGKYHNAVLTRFHEKHSFSAEKISDPEIYFTLMDESLHEVMDTSIFNIEKAQFTYEYIPILFEMRDFGAIDVFSLETINPVLIGQFFFQKGWLSQVEADWLVGFVSCILNSSTTGEAFLAINNFTFNNGLPVPESTLGIVYNITIHSMTYWSDTTKWGLDWRGFGSGIADGLSGGAGVMIGGAAGGGIGALIGGVYLGNAGSSAMSMMYSAWDEYYP